MNPTVEGYQGHERQYDGGRVSRLVHGVFNPSEVRFLAGRVADYFLSDRKRAKQPRLFEDISYKPVLAVHGWGETDLMMGRVAASVLNAGLVNIYLLRHDFLRPMQETARRVVYPAAREAVQRTRDAYMRYRLVGLFASPSYKKSGAQLRQKLADIIPEEGLNLTEAAQVVVSAARRSELRELAQREIKRTREQDIRVAIVAYSQGVPISRQFAYDFIDEGLASHGLFVAGANKGSWLAILALIFGYGDILHTIGMNGRVPYAYGDKEFHYTPTAKGAVQLLPWSKFFKNLDRQHNELCDRGDIPKKFKILNIFSSHDVVAGKKRLRNAVNVNVSALSGSGQYPDLDGRIFSHGGLSYSELLGDVITDILGPAFNGNFEELSRMNERGLIAYLAEYHDAAPRRAWERRFSSEQQNLEDFLQNQSGRI